MLDSECAILFYFIFWVCYFSSGESSLTFLPHFCLVLWFSRSVVSASLWPHERQHTFSLSQSLLRFVFIDSVMPSDHLILCRPLLPLPSVFPSIRVFSNELPLCIRWPKDWSFSFSISPSNEYSGFISFRKSWWVAAIFACTWMPFDACTVLDVYTVASGMHQVNKMQMKSECVLGAHHLVMR